MSLVGHGHAEVQAEFGDVRLWDDAGENFPKCGKNFRAYATEFIYREWVGFSNMGRKHPKGNPDGPVEDKFEMRPI